MKKQYLGDIRDLFKFDLVSFMFSNEPIFDTFSYIPMLTPNKSKNNDGKFRNYDAASAGYENKILREYLSKYNGQNPEQRDFGIIRDYFKCKKININIYEDIDFTKDRKRYFEQIPKNIITSSLVFIDPDNGMQPVKKPNEKHVLFSEIKSIFNKGDENTVVSVIQFRRIKEQDDYWKKYKLNRKCQLEENVSRYVTSISDKKISFYFIARNKKALKFIKTQLENYNKIYIKLCIT